MLRTHWQHSAKGVVDYLSAADYYATSPGDLLGKGFEHLDISGMTPRDVLECLAHNFDPATGNILRKHAKDGDRVGMDFTFNAPKSVTLAREISGTGNVGDSRIEDAHREAVEYAMGHIEADMKTRVRVGGADHDRVTGNLFAYRVTHRDTRINPGDQMPDPHLHDHVFVMNLTFDPVEQKFKAAQIGQIKHDAPYYEAMYMNRLAHNLQAIGYGVRRDGKAFEVAGIDRPLIDKFSRRSKQIEAVTAKLGITNPESKAKLGATTRLGKAKELADDLNGYYVSRLTDAEKQQLTQLRGQPSYQCDEEKAVRFAIDHIFERQSVVEERKLYETAIRHGIGSVTPEEVQQEVKRQGGLFKDGQVTTRAVLAEEGRIIDFAREGKGTMRPLGKTASLPDHTATSTSLAQQKSRPNESKRLFELKDGVVGSELHKQLPRSGSDESVGVQAKTATLSSEQQAVSVDARNAQAGGMSPKSTSGTSLSPEQAALVNHILTSPDQVVLVVGDAGTGKTSAVRSAFDRIHCPVEMLAPSADASRGVLRSEGFSKADTVTSFLLSPERQEKVKNGVIWVDEAGMLPIRDLSKLTDIARAQNARLILQGDPKQHRSPARHGNMMNLLQEYAGLPVGRLSEIWRQKHQGYKRIVADIAHGDRSGALDGLTYLGWVQKVEDNAPLVEDYVAALNAKKSVLVVAPTHAEGGEVTADIRARLKQDGKIGKDDHVVRQLVAANWTEAERGDLERYDGSEVLVFHRNSGTFKAGQVVPIAEFKPGDHWKSAGHFSVYHEAKLSVAAGDVIRITARGKTTDGHRLDNGSLYRVKGFNKHGGLVLDNGWTVAKDFGHLNHGYVSTSHASQGKTVDRVLIAMGSESRRAINAEQFYVSVSRGRESAKVYTDMTPEELKAAIQRADQRQSATELMKPKKKRRVYDRVRNVLAKARDRFKSLHSGLEPQVKQRELQKEIEYGLGR